LASNSTGSGNTASGYQALNKNSTGNGNTAFGWQALFFNRNGARNNAFGTDALSTNTSGNDNIAIGSSALENNDDGNDNTAVGPVALFWSSGDNGNTAVGFGALSMLGVPIEVGGPGSFNIALGDSAGSNLESGSHNMLHWQSGRFCRVERYSNRRCTDSRVHCRRSRANNENANAIPVV